MAEVEGLGDEVGDVDHVNHAVSDPVPVALTVPVAVGEAEEDTSTEGGEFSCKVVPVPSWPYALSPQHRKPLSFIRAQV